MILFLSDLHLGRGPLAEERLIEADAIDCLRSHEDRVSGLYLVGDVFDAYIEYRHLVPKGFVRFKGLLADWTDAGIPVTYLAGNHDPWHRDYFERELGVRVVFDDITEPLYGRNVYLAHGDGMTSANAVYNRLRPVLRHPLPVWLYTTLLPSDGGFALAQWVKRVIGKHEVDAEAVEAFRAYARDRITTRRADLVVMGHTHAAELTAWPEGTYLNPGYWHESRTFGRLDTDGAQLLRWTGTTAECVLSEPL